MTDLSVTEHRHLSVMRGFNTVAQDIKLSHTVFAMPWALLAMFLAAQGWPHWGQVALIVVCMVSARTVAMITNRLVDARLDAQNPRTARRALPSGAMSVRSYVAILAGSAVVFVGATSGFGLMYSNLLPLTLSAPVLLFIAAYPFLKRFTQLCHYYLGAALAMAPVCAWIAISGTVTLTPLLMAGAVLFWTAGFDIIYACLDFESDRATGVVSVPARLGIAGALWVSRVSHLISVAFMIALGLHAEQLETLYFLGVGIAAALLVVEHSLVSPRDLSKVGIAFFTVNGIISLVLGTLGIVDVFV